MRVWCGRVGPRITSVAEVEYRMLFERVPKGRRAASPKALGRRSKLGGKPTWEQRRGAENWDECGRGVRRVMAECDRRSAMQKGERLDHDDGGGNTDTQKPVGAYESGPSIERAEEERRGIGCDQ